MDCGPTCLRMVAKHYGRHYSAQTMRVKAQLGKDGVSMLGIAEAAEAVGFKTVGVRISLEKLVEEVPLPCILALGAKPFCGALQSELGFPRPELSARYPGRAQTHGGFGRGYGRLARQGTYR